MSETQAAEVADRMMESMVTGFELAAISMGVTLGWYDALAKAPDGLTPAALAVATGTHERYCREWLEQQAVAGVLHVAAANEAAGADQRFAISPSFVEVLVDADSQLYLAPLVRQVMAAARNLPLVVDAVRAGGGVPWAAMGDDMWQSQGAANRVGFLTSMAGWIQAMPDVTARLATTGARIADIGCGTGWSTIALAQAFPQARVDGFDIDAASVDAARRLVEEQGLVSRVSVERVDVAELAGATADGAAIDREERGYDLVTAFECVHDMPDPVGVLRAVLSMLREGGAVLVADEGVAETFAPPGDLVERLMYGFSLTICLPDSMSTPGSVATGTAMRPAVLANYAEQAGFARTDVLDIDHDLWRFYRLFP